MKDMAFTSTKKKSILRHFSRGGSQMFVLLSYIFYIVKNVGLNCLYANKTIVKGL